MLVVVDSSGGAITWDAFVSPSVSGQSGSDRSRSLVEWLRAVGSRVPKPVRILCVGVGVVVLIAAVFTVLGTDYRLASTGDDERIEETSLDTAAVSGVTVEVTFRDVDGVRNVDVVLPSGDQLYINATHPEGDRTVSFDVNEPGTIEFRYYDRDGRLLDVDRIRLVADGGL